jgi:hypothetical protein
MRDSHIDGTDSGNYEYQTQAQGTENGVSTRKSAWIDTIKIVSKQRGC